MNEKRPFLSTPFALCALMFLLICPRAQAARSFSSALACAKAICPRAQAASAAERPVVFVSIPPQAWLIKRLAGEAVEVQTLLTSGANPHTYEPTARQVRKLAEAKLYLTVGMPFETPLATRAVKLNPALKMAAMDAGTKKRGSHAHDHDDHGHADSDPDCCGTGGDPHIWLSPRLMCAMASNTLAALAEALPENRTQMTENLHGAMAEILAADDTVRAELKGLKSRTWVVYHPSWGYFAETYGLTLLILEQDGKTPSAKHLAQVIRQAQAAGVKTVFTEPQYDKRPARILAEQIGARLTVIDPLQEDWPALMRDVAKKLAGE